MAVISLAMSLAYDIVQLCDFVGLDGALFLAVEPSCPMLYGQGVISGSMTQLWGEITGSFGRGTDLVKDSPS